MGRPDDRPARAESARQRCGDRALRRVRVLAVRPRRAAGSIHRTLSRGSSPVIDADAAVAFTAPDAMTGITDAVSGGQFASLVEIMRSGRGRLPDPHALDPVRSRQAGGYDLRPRRHTGTHVRSVLLFPSPLINPPVLHRSAALLRADGDTVFAPNYRYREGTVTASMLGPANACRASHPWPQRRWR